MRPRSPEIELMPTIVPRRWVRNRFAAGLHQAMQPPTLTFRIARSFSVSYSSGPTSGMIPAAKTIRSSPPSSRTISSKSSGTSSVFTTSCGCTKTWPPDSKQASAALSASSWSLSARRARAATRYPSPASWRTSAAPMPELAPTTIARRWSAGMPARRGGTGRSAGDPFGLAMERGRRASSDRESPRPYPRDGKRPPGGLSGPAGSPRTSSAGPDSRSSGSSPGRGRRGSRSTRRAAPAG